MVVLPFMVSLMNNFVSTYSVNIRLAKWTVVKAAYLKLNGIHAGLVLAVMVMFRNTPPASNDTLCLRSW